MESVLHGSSGKWGNKVHMRSQEQVSKEEASLLVKYILSLSDTAE
jgi:cytochrome c551/c552